MGITLGKATGITVNRLTVGLAFALIHQTITGIGTSILSIPLSGNIQDLLLGIDSLDADTRILVVTWWVVSTIIFTVIAAQLVRFRKYISPYKKESLEVFPEITLVNLLVLGAIMSVLFFLVDLVIGAIGSTSNIQTIYQAVVSGDLEPLVVSMIFSIAAGFVVVGVIGRATKVKEITRGVGAINLDGIRRKLIKGDLSAKTAAETAGLAPGVLVHVGHKKVDRVWFSAIRYDADHLVEVSKTYDIEECLGPTGKGVSWLGMVGIHDTESVKRFGERFGLHQLYQADIMNTELRPSVQEDGNNLFMILKIPYFDSDGMLVVDQVSLALGPDYVLSFQETEVNIFDSVLENIRQSRGNMREMGSDYLAYALIDAVVDSLFVIMERISDKTASLEHQLMSDPGPKTLETIHHLKRQIATLRRIIWPLREMADSLERSDSPLIQPDTKRYLRDVYGHLVQTMDVIESLRDVIGGMLDTYLSSISNKTNEVMKTLTVIASIFIPITFIAGIYGTNFEYVPELEFEGGYFVMLTAMGTVSIAMLAWFRRKKWL